mgnify:FL=1
MIIVNRCVYIFSLLTKTRTTTTPATTTTTPATTTTTPATTTRRSFVTKAPIEIHKERVNNFTKYDRVDIFGNDIECAAATPESCKAKCSQDLNCKAYNTNLGGCCLKKSFGAGKRPAAGSTLYGPTNLQDDAAWYEEAGAQAAAYGSHTEHVNNFTRYDYADISDNDIECITGGDATPEKCKAKCLKELKCKAYSVAQTGEFGDINKCCIKNSTAQGKTPYRATLWAPSNL